MTIPLVVLAFGAAFLGVILQRSPEGTFSKWAEAATRVPPAGEVGLPVAALTTIATAIAVLTLVATWAIYASGRIDWMALRVRLAPIQRLFANGWYVDEYYSTILVTPGKAASAFVAYVVDAKVIDGAVNGIGAGTRRLAGVGRKLQTGYVRTYAAAIFLGGVGILVYLGFRV
jgi:NADH-quinone oxidoreductase subunit L